ncbi:MAG: hypothetical protein RMX99_009040 [Aulosira sp. DedVER01a]|nr:hypothetical protein [Aulosira sp. ZfuVER01]MDZ7999890.1 hypothetical protein [Aulosira sp. DedVER01a]
MKGKRQNIINKTIALLLAMQIFLIGLQAKVRIDQSNSSLEALIWITQQYISVLIKVRDLQEKKEKGNSQIIKETTGKDSFFKEKTKP